MWRSVRAGGAMALLVCAVAAAACTASRRGSLEPTTASTASASSAGTPPMTFGDLTSPCGPGNATGATDQGVTDTTVRIGYGDDRGFPQSPGLDQEVGDAIRGMIKWCNDQGGILGRKVDGDFYDAAVVQANAVTSHACKVDFMLVGEGWALDEAAEGTRVACNLAAVPAFTIGADFANGPMMYQAVPNAVDYLPASPYYEMAMLFPALINKTDVIHSTLAAATEVAYNKDLEAMAAAGWTNVHCGVTVNYQGEPDYKPFARQFQRCGVGLIYDNFSPGPLLFGMLTAANQLGLRPTYLMETNAYSTELSAWNTSGIGDNIYIRDAFVPLEEAEQVPAVKQYLSIVTAVGGKADELGEQAASSFLLWATAAKACGSSLTRQCMINNLSKVHTWTGGGLHAPTDPGSNIPPGCGMLLKLTGTTFRQFYPTAPTKFDCSDKYLFKISQAHWGTTLGPDRIATKFLGPKVIRPQS